jgi:hypothetical protein
MRTYKCHVTVMCDVGPPFVTRMNILGNGSVVDELIGLTVDLFVTCPVGACHQVTSNAFLLPKVGRVGCYSLP